MVTSSFINSLNVVTEMSKTSTASKPQGDDKFKELMKRDDAPKGSEDKKQDSNKVNEKVDKENVKNTDENLAKEDGTYEKVISSEVAKMLVNVTPIVTDLNVQASDGKGAVLIDNSLAQVDLENVGVNGQTIGLGEEMNSLQEGQVAGGNINTNVNPEIASQEGKIQLNEGFEPVKMGEEKNVLASLVKEGMENNGVSEEKVDESLVTNVVKNDSLSAKLTNVSVEGSQEVVKSEQVFRPEETIDNMVKTFVKEFSQGRHEMEIQLEPVNLGKLTIKVAYEAGKAVVSILCSERNLDIISKNSAQLAGILQQYTGDDTQIVVEQPHMDYLGQENDKNNQRQNEKEYKDNEKANDDKEAVDFLEQLRLGLVKEV